MNWLRPTFFSKFFSHRGVGAGGDRGAIKLRQYPNPILRTSRFAIFSVNHKYLILKLWFFQSVSLLLKSSPWHYLKKKILKSNETRCVWTQKSYNSQVSYLNFNPAPPPIRPCTLTFYATCDAGVILILSINGAEFNSARRNFQCLCTRKNLLPSKMKRNMC